MTFTATDLLTVYLNTANRLKVGRLATFNRQLLFEYDPFFVQFSQGRAIYRFQLTVTDSTSKTGIELVSVNPKTAVEAPSIDQLPYPPTVAWKPSVT